MKFASKNMNNNLHCRLSLIRTAGRGHKKKSTGRTVQPRLKPRETNVDKLSLTVQIQGCDIVIIIRRERIYANITVAAR